MTPPHRKTSSKKLWKDVPKITNIQPRNITNKLTELNWVQWTSVTGKVCVGHADRLASYTTSTQAPHGREARNVGSMSSSKEWLNVWWIRGFFASQIYTTDKRHIQMPKTTSEWHCISCYTPLSSLNGVPICLSQAARPTGRYTIELWHGQCDARRIV